MIIKFELTTADEIQTIIVDSIDEAVHRIKEVELKEINLTIEANEKLLAHYKETLSGSNNYKYITGKIEEIINNNYEYKDFLEDANTLNTLHSLGVPFRKIK